MSLLQGVLRSTAGDPASTIERRLNALNLANNNNSTQPTADDEDEELVAVTSAASTPSRTRPPSPSRSGAAARRIPGPLHLSSSAQQDPLRLFSTDVSQKIFKNLSLRDLARCSLVSKKWNRSQTLNYVWFLHYRQENFNDESLPPGKWTKRESKQNWRTTHLQSSAKNEKAQSGQSYSRGSGYSSPALASGYQTPRELKEEKWRQEAEGAAKPGKVEMREMYKELGGRKAKGKGKLGSSGVARDKGGWNDAGADEFW